MTIAIIAVSVAEMAVFFTVLAVYLIAIDRRLRGVSATLGKVAFGVRAVESQTGPIGSAVLRINATLRDIVAALGPLADKARRAADARG